MKQLKELTTKELEALLRSKARRMGMVFIYWDAIDELQKRYLNKENETQSIYKH